MVDQPELSDHQHGLVGMMLKYGVRFVVIGGMALRTHGVARATSDIDLWMSPTRDDAERLARLFSKVAGGSPEQWVTQVFRSNLRMPYPNDQQKEADILTSIDGADFEAAYRRRESARFGELMVPVVSLADLVELKKLALASTNSDEAKARDQADLEALAAL